MSLARPCRLAATVAAALALAAPWTAAQAQLGGLIKKKVSQATAPKSTGEPVAFDDVILELTPERIAKVIAGKTAGRRIADGPNGPAAIRRKIEQLDDRQTRIYEKQVGAINKWDEQRQDAERCRDSVLTVAGDQLNLDNSPAYRQKFIQLGLRMAQAQQRGDSAEMRRITEELRRASAPSAADSARAVQTCPLPAPPTAVQEWMTLKAQLEQLQRDLEKAEQEVSEAELSASGMNRRQVAMACERIALYLQRAQASQKQVGFTAAELDALDQALKDLQDLCK